jgi:predicted nucleic acid-binding Zn ribbon protein
MSLENYNLVLFKEISKFTNELSNVFGSKSTPLKLYNRLINKTTISHDVAIKKHINIFKKFCSENTVAIINKEYNQFKNSILQYSSRVYIDLNFLFKTADKNKDNKELLWNGLSSLSSILEPVTNAKEILNNEKSKNEVEFLRRAMVIVKNLRS